MIELETRIVPEWGSTNVLGLPKSSEIYCDVRHYRNSHALMRIALQHLVHEPPPQLIFHSPLYFEGPLKWTGAQVNVGAEEDMFELLIRLGYKREDMLPSPRKGDMRLYQIPIITSSSTPYTVQIIAQSFTLSSQHITVGMIYDS
jgi:hypothetical protein